MVHEGSAASFVLPVVTALLAAAIFAVDTFSPLGMAVAVLYVVVIVLSLNFLRWRGMLLVSLGCGSLTVLSYLLSHGLRFDGTPFVRFVVSLAAIGITALLALRNQTSGEALREQAQLLDLTHDSVFARDMHDVITYWNRGAAELYGWRKEEAVGKNAHQLMQTSFPAPLREITAKLLNVGRWEGELVHARRQGPPVVVDSRWSLKRDERGQAAGVLETNTDITARRSAEEKLHEARAELAHVTRMTTLGEFTASIAHEVNQPLAAVITNGEVVLRMLDQDDPDLNEIREAVNDVVRNGRRAGEVIRRLRLLSTKAASDMSSISINDVINEIVSLIEREVLGHRVRLELKLAPALPPVLGDSVQLQQVVMNLLINGMEAMATITGRPRELVIRSEESESGEVLVLVRDSGVGIEEESAARLFDAFYTTKPTGMGMGLSICRSIIDHHGGRIWASPNPDAGATLHFTLPAYREARP